MLDPSALPRRAGQLHLITDRLAAPAEFILLNILGSHLKQVKRKCILVSFSQALSHWKSVSARLSPPTNISSHISTGSFVFIDALSEPHTLSAEPLRHLYDRISQALEECSDEVAVEDCRNLVILDSLSMLDWSGVPAIEVKRFRCASLIVRHHQIVSDGLDDLMRDLLFQCAWHLEVLPLASGRSGAISGEVAVHRGPLLDDSDAVDAIKRSLAIQYRLSDTGPIYFGRGTSAGVL
ncbi:hypothetical protein EW145_g4136 [Phellinidium pouzarii]|uniref:Elongator complex protein 5 n=1 Tax=Phellinidium pouzarii TaxID=167371 RepID=A0A4S4L9Q5_9AGAM|nr:hypothetical protein EW145_g4136 [Phellinidium pouzarii]